MRWLVRGERDVPRDPAWLTPSEAYRVAGLRFTKRRNEFLLRRLAAKHAVAAVAGLPTDLASLSRIEVGNEPGGAPYVLVDARPAGIGVSLTDRSGWAVCLAGGDRAGCDLEIVEPRSPGFVRDYLTPREQSYVYGALGFDAAANLVWSAKESALKVLRTGLRRDPRSVEVTIVDDCPGRWSPLSVRTAEGLELPGWWRRDGRFVFTMASPYAGPPPAALEDPTSVLAAAAPVDSWLARPVSPAVRPRRRPYPVPARR